MKIHQFLDSFYGENGDNELIAMLQERDLVDCMDLMTKERPIHVATRRRRVSAVRILLEHGADIDAKNRFGKTAYAHAIRRGFNDVVDVLKKYGANEKLNVPDQFAVAVVTGKLDEARRILETEPDCVRTGNPEEDRLLADVAGRPQLDAVRFLVASGADLSAPALDGGTPLHQAAWFGQTENAKLLIESGAPLEIFDQTHFSSPLGWAVHGSRYSGGAEKIQDAYTEIVRILLAAGSKLHYPVEPHDKAFLDRLLKDASPEIRELLVLPH